MSRPGWRAARAAASSWREAPLASSGAGALLAVRGWLAVLAALCLVPACGYSFASGAARMPLGAERIFVRPLDDRTTDPEAGALVATALRSELARRGADGGPGAGARIEGTVEGTSFYPLGLNPPTYRLSLAVSARLVVAGKVTAEQRVNRVEDWLSGLDPVESEGRRRLALRRAAEAAAREILERFEQP